MSDELDNFSDFNYWRMPPPPQQPLDDIGSTAAMEEETEEFNDFSFWRVPPPPLQQAERPASPGESVRETRREWLEVEGPSEDEDDEVEDPMSMLSGRAGIRLLGLLGQLSQHLGESSRFSRAAGLLQQDMLRQREAMQQTPAARIAPVEGSTLETPEVRSSVGSLLTILQDQRGPSRWLDDDAPVSVPAPRTGPITGLFDLADVPMPPPSPASPESVSALSPPCDRFCLGKEEALSCPICLEALDDPAGALQMPCAKQHVFHKQCLLTWLDARNTCPICRHSMPTCEEVDDPAPTVEEEEEMAEAETDHAESVLAEAAGVEEFELIGIEQIEQTEPPSEGV